MKKITVSLHIGGVKVDKLTPEQAQKMADALSKGMSEYYTVHSEEFKKIKV